MKDGNEVLELAREAGFDLAGIAPLQPPRDAHRFEEWLAAGHHGEMEYLARNRERIVDPRRILANGRSLLVVGLSHARAATPLEDGARVARYALGRDYHNVMIKRLRRLAARLREGGWVGDERRAIVDAGPLLERSHAAEAGVGFLSKAANLLHPDFGPWFFLGELILDREYEPTREVPAGSCGTCRACIDACPTGALLEPGRLDARLCISYQTIENRGSIPRELRADLGSWVFGCDVCSEVCPWGEQAPSSEPLFGTHAAVAEGSLVRWLAPGEVDETHWAGSPLKRARRAGLARNSAIVLGNQPSEQGEIALLRALRDPAPIVREAAAWALARAHAHDAGKRELLASAAEREEEPGVQADMRRNLEELS